MLLLLLLSKESHKDLMPNTEFTSTGGEISLVSTPLHFPLEDTGIPLHHPTPAPQLLTDILEIWATGTPLEELSTKLKFLTSFNYLETTLSLDEL